MTLILLRQTSVDKFTLTAKKEIANINKQLIPAPEELLYEKMSSHILGQNSLELGDYQKNHLKLPILMVIYHQQPL